MTPRNCLMQNDFKFIGKFKSLGKFQDYQLSADIERYNRSHVTLFDKYISAFTKNQLSKTEIIKRIYNFYSFQHQTLINIQKESQKQMLLAKNSEDIEYFKQILKQSQVQLENARVFIRWADTIVSHPSCNIKDTLLSKTHQEKPYNDKSSDNTADSDQNHFNAGKPIELPPRLQREREDPLHRPWGTQGVIGDKLRPIYEEWKDSRSPEDLTVEIEFDDAKKEAAAIYVKYFTEEEALSHLVTKNVDDELSYNNSDDSTPISTDGDYIYVMDKLGNLFIHKDRQYIDSEGNYYPNNDQFNPNWKLVNHSSFTRGESVACAGEISIVDGKITKINNCSGHYQPAHYSLHRVVSELNKRGVLDEKCEVTVFNKAKFSVSRFLESITPSKKPANLSEKPNPKNFLNCLANINLYLKKRAKETEVVGSLFGRYTGKDYFDRRDNFKDILSKLQAEDVAASIHLIDKSIDRFENKFFGRNDYVNLLKKLKSSLQMNPLHNDHVLQIDYVSEKVRSYFSLYHNMHEHMKKVLNFDQKFKLFSSNKSVTEIISPRVDYRYNLEDLDEKTKNEFLTNEELHDLDYKNVKCM